MQHTLLYPSLGATDLDSNPIFNVVIAYEDFETGKQAKKTYDFLAENLGRDCQLNHQMWKFDVLALPKLREMAAKDAATADIIIISCRGGSELPNSVKNWIELWLAEKRAAIALVALFDRPHDHLFQSREVRDYLSGVALRGGLEFFAQPEDGAGKSEGTAPVAFDDGLKRDDRALSTLAGAVQKDNSFPRWGISE